MDPLDVWFEIQNYVLAVGLISIMTYMFFIIYKVGSESKVGKFGMFILIVVLGAGMIGFIAKHVIAWFLGL